MLYSGVNSRSAAIPLEPGPVTPAAHSASLPAVLALPATPDSPLWRWAEEAILERLEGMLQHTEGVRRGEDIEAVHDMRVGSRRLVAAMRVFRACFPGTEYEDLLAEARRVTRRLGAVRDLDVLIDYFERLDSNAEPAWKPGIEYFVAVMEAERKRARRPMLAAPASLERGRLAERVGRFIRAQAEAYAVGLPPFGRAPEADGPFRAAAPPALRNRYDYFYSFAEHVAHPERAAELHEMRIAAKWLRYTMELFGPAYAGGLKPELAVVRKFQELLGDLHDSDVRLDLLSRMTSGPLDVRGLMAVGRMLPDPVEESLRLLLRREEEVRADCYQAFYREWKRQERKGFAQACAQRIADADA